jgi:hypothetical protein
MAVSISLDLDLGLEGPRRWYWIFRESALLNRSEAVLERVCRSVLEVDCKSIQKFLLIRVFEQQLRSQ